MQSKKRKLLAALLLCTMLASGVTEQAANQQDTERTMECIRYNNGSIYIGQRKDNKFDGYGMLYNPSEKGTGFFYCGEWKDHWRHGEGVLYMADGTRYAGTFVDNRLSEKSKDTTHSLYVDITESTATVCERTGDGVYDGVGAFLMHDGSFYAGTVRAGSLGGKGVYGIPAENFWYLGRHTGQCIPRRGDCLCEGCSVFTGV